jgi:hypothetical protein
LTRWSRRWKVLVSASRVSSRISLSSMKLTRRTHWKHWKFEQGTAWFDYSEGKLCLVWTLMYSYNLFSRCDICSMYLYNLFRRCEATLCHGRRLFRRCDLCSMYFLQSGYAIVRFASEKHSENKWHFLLFSSTFCKVQGCSGFCCICHVWYIVSFC